jgi:general secretion pathway protein B
MSYILDALRKAEAERQRGQVPGVLAPVAPAPPGPAPAERHRRLPASVAGAVLALTLLSLLGWWWWPAAAPTAPVRPTVSSPVPAATPARPAEPSLPQVVSAAPTAPVPAVAPPAATAPVPAPAPAPTPAVTTPVPAPTPAIPPAPRPTRLADLPPEQRSAFPQMMLGGSVWSESPASRFVFINGQMLREGDAVSPEASVERLLPKAVVLRWRGQLVELPL